MHELCYRGFDDVVDDAEQVVDVIAVRRCLEASLEQRLRERWTDASDVEPADVPETLQAMVADDDGPSLADHVRRDEYGDGDPNRLLAHLFARGMVDVGLRAEYGAYVDDALPETLELNNGLSMFGLVGRLRGAAMGHLAAFEMTSSLPARKMVQGLERLGLTGAMVDKSGERVEADAGPMLVRGATSIEDEKGTVHTVDRPVVALCRCEKSSRLPWCDGTHKVIPRRRS